MFITVNKGITPQALIFGARKNQIDNLPPSLNSFSNSIFIDRDCTPSTKSLAEYF